MKRVKQWAGRIKRCHFNRIIREQKGSIVLEAAIVMPIIMFMLLALIIFIHINAVQIALQSSAMQTVRVAAAHWYPVDLALQQFVNEQTEEANNSEQSPIRDMAASASSLLPEPAGTLISAAVSGDWQPVINMAATELGRSAIEPLVKQYASSPLLQSDKISLVQLSLPHYKNKDNSELGITITYQYPLKVPILQYPIVLEAGAVERVWIPDVLAAVTDETGEADEQPLTILSIEPDPVRPGRKATVIVQAAPGENVSLAVIYKSGLSKAKHLGDAIADEDGKVSWTWHVSGNTTPGLWEIIVTSEDREGRQRKKLFKVEKSDHEAG